jgi:hypothetical protein
MKQKRFLHHVSTRKFYLAALVIYFYITQMIISAVLDIEKVVEEWMG